jgi:pSer/pThr/pTyr-binding forkhead associated (FHA) protein
MTFAAQMRVGSLEITAALLAVAAVAARPSVAGVREFARNLPVRLGLRIIELGNERAFDARCPLTIGRARESGLVLSDPEVSRSHASLECEDGVVYVHDLDSSNGTFLNGRRITEPIEVRLGDEIDVGTTRLIVEELAPWT